MPKRRKVTPAVKAQINEIRAALQRTRVSRPCTLDDVVARAKAAGAVIDRATVHALTGAREAQDFQISTLLDVANALGLTIVVSEQSTGEREHDVKTTEPPVHGSLVRTLAHEPGGPQHGDSFSTVADTLAQELAKTHLLARLLQNLGGLRSEHDALVERVARLEHGGEGPARPPARSGGRHR